MEITIRRLLDNHKSTIGELYVDGIRYCATAEDTFRHVKVKGVTRIPEGRYEAVLRKEGGMYPKYLSRFGTDGMLWLRDVPGFDWVYIHIGNTERDSEGCILVGDSALLDFDQSGGVEYSVRSSTETYKNLHALVAPVIEGGDRVFVTILDN